jgi:hypothetical protein
MGLHMLVQWNINAWSLRCTMKTLDEGEWSASRSGLFCLQEKSSLYPTDHQLVETDQSHNEIARSSYVNRPKCGARVLDASPEPPDISSSIQAKTVTTEEKGGGL